MQTFVGETLPSAPPSSLGERPTPAISLVHELKARALGPLLVKEARSARAVPAKLMSFPIACTACRAKFNMSARLWDERVAGRMTVIHCRKCRAPITLDGTRSSGAADRVPAAAQDAAPTPGLSGSPPRSVSSDVRPTTTVAPTARGPVARAAQAAPWASGEAKPSASSQTKAAPKAASRANSTQKAVVTSPASVERKAVVTRPASVAPKPTAAAESDGGPPPATCSSLVANLRPLVRDSTLVSPESAPSLRALEVTRVPLPCLSSEPPEETELAHEFGEDRTPAGVLVDRAVPLARRSRVNGAAAFASGALALTLGATMWWQASRSGAPSSPGRRLAVAERAAVQPRLHDPRRDERAIELKLPAPQVSSAPAEERAPGVVESAPGAAHDVQRLEFALRWARTHAERCHQGGRAVGTAELAITFSPAGKVTAVHLTGEPIAGAPVAHCVTSFFQSMLIPPFGGEAFTIHETLTLR